MIVARHSLLLNAINILATTIILGILITPANVEADGEAEGGTPPQDELQLIVIDKKGNMAKIGKECVKCVTDPYCETICETQECCDDPNFRSAVKRTCKQFKGHTLNRVCPDYKARYGNKGEDE